MILYDPKISEEITKLGGIVTVSYISNWYNVDVLVIQKYKEIYGQYPQTFLDLTERSEYYEQRLRDIERVLKINKIIKQHEK